MRTPLHLPGSIILDGNFELLIAFTSTLVIRVQNWCRICYCL